jgi:hypothetical protein
LTNLRCDLYLWAVNKRASLFGAWDEIEETDMVCPVPCPYCGDNTHSQYECIANLSDEERQRAQQVMDVRFKRILLVDLKSRGAYNKLVHDLSVHPQLARQMINMFNNEDADRDKRINRKVGAGSDIFNSERMP